MRSQEMFWINQNIFKLIYKDGGNIKGKRDRRTKNLQKIWVELDGMIKDDDTLAEIIDAKLELNWEMEKEEMY